MLLSTKIDNLLADESVVIDSMSDTFIAGLNLNGQVQTKNFLLMKILYFLLNDTQLIIQHNIRKSMFKFLQHLIEVTQKWELKSVSDEPIPVTTPTITVTPTLAFGSVNVGTSSTLPITVAGSNLTHKLVESCPLSVYTISADDAYNFVSSMSLYPDSQGDVATTLYIKYTPTAGAVNNTTITFSSTGAANQTITVTGTGVAVP